MIRFACPGCKKVLSAPLTQAGAVSSCPDCGKKFKIPTGAKTSANGAAHKPVRAQKERFSDEEDEEVDLPASSRKVRKRQSVPATDDNAEDRDERDDEVEEEEKPRPKKKKKKKKRQDDEPGLTGLHISLIVGGIVAVMLITGAVYYIQKGGAKKPPPNLNELIAEIQRHGGSVVRDDKSPDSPVVGVNFAGAEFPPVPPEILGRLAAFPKLARIDLGGAKLGDVQLEHLEDVTQLRVLNLGNTKVTGGGMQFLKKMSNLEELYLNSTYVTDVGLEHLKGCKKLKKINIDGTLANGYGLREAIPGLEVMK